MKKKFEDYIIPIGYIMPFFDKPPKESKYKWKYMYSDCIANFYMRIK